MKIIACIFLILFSSMLYSQVNYAKETDYKDFMKTKTLIVLENKLFSTYNETIQEVVKSVWKITPYEIISAKEFDTRKYNKACSFIMLTDAALDQKGVVMQYNMLNLIMGGKAKNLNDMPDLGSFPLSCSDEDEEDYLYKTGGILQFMQYFVRYNLNHPNTDLIKLFKSIETNIGNKEIWLLRNELDNAVNTTEKIKKFYAGKVKFAPKEEIAIAIARKDADIVFLHKIGNAIKGSICWKALIDAGNGELLYFDQYKIDAKHPNAFTAEDFSKLKSK
jgi:hypothetical protein